MPLDPDIDPVTDIPVPAEPELYAKVWPREDGDWGVSIRSDNNQHIFGNDEGWRDLAYTLDMTRRAFPGIRIVIYTDPDEEAARTVIDRDEELPTF